VVLGCTVGAGQTITALMIGEVLASLRSEHVAVLDLNPGPGSLVRRAQARPALSQAASLGSSKLAVLGARSTARPGGPGQDGELRSGASETGNDETDQHLSPVDAARTFDAASTRHALVIADPSSSVVPRMLGLADQLVLVAPASAAAAGAIAMTFEWLEAHGQADLAARSIMALNGVSRRSMLHVEQAERVCVGRCRALVRVPWDDQLSHQVARQAHQDIPGGPARQHWAGVLSPSTVGAYTALGGVLVAALAGHGHGRQGEPHDPQPATSGQAPR
jgi:MinD-like ATPase involved in chromosome partitioning or flagellar assembly